MGNQKDGNREHAYQQIARDIKEGALPGVVLLCGEEEYLIRWALSAILDKYVPDPARPLDVSRIEAGSAGWEDMIHACETLPMMADCRVVVVEDAGNLNPDALQEGFRIPDWTRLVLLFSGLPSASSGKALEQWMSPEGKAYRFHPLDERQLAGFVGKRFREAGKVAEPRILSRIARESGYLDKDSGYGLMHLSSDLLKITAHASGMEITSRDVEACLGPTVEGNTFAMLDAVSKNRKDEAFRLLHDQLKFGENPYRLLSSMVSQIELMLCVKELRQEGKSPVEIQAILKVHELRVRKALAFSEKYSIQELRRVLLEACQVDSRIKTGFLDPEAALEMLIAAV